MFQARRQPVVEFRDVDLLFVEKHVGLPVKLFQEQDVFFSGQDTDVLCNHAKNRNIGPEDEDRLRLCRPPDILPYLLP